MGNPYATLDQVVERRFIAKLAKLGQQDRKQNGRRRFLRSSRRPWNNATEYTPK